MAHGGGNIVGQGGGNFHPLATATENTRSEVAEAATKGDGGFIQDGGETNLTGVSITGDVTLNGGVLSGSGTIYGSLTNKGGYIAPGHSAGILSVTGNFTQSANGTLILEDGGATPNKFDQLQVDGKATLGGNLDLKLINGYKPNKADTFSPLSFASHTGKFASVSSNAGVTLHATGILTTVDPAKAAPETGQARNLSTRANVQTGDNVVIGGFIVTGPAGSTKKIIVRGIGPSLASVGIMDSLADPYLELHHGANVVASNDNWQEHAAAVKATRLAPSSPLESAIVATLAPGAYTVVLHGAHNETGVGLVEIYDL